MKRILIGVCVVVCCLLLYACANDIVDAPPAAPPSVGDLPGVSDEGSPDVPQETQSTPEPTPDSSQGQPGGSDRYDALTANSVENNMIGPVTAVFRP